MTDIFTLKNGPFDGRKVSQPNCKIEVRRGDKILFAVYHDAEFQGYRDPREDEETFSDKLEKPKKKASEAEQEKEKSDEDSEPSKSNFLRE